MNIQRQRIRQMISAFQPVLLSAILMMMASCSGLTRTSKVNISQSYEQSPERPAMEFRIHVQTDTSAIVYARIPESQLSMIMPMERRSAEIKWSLFNGYESNTPIDTGRFSIPETLLTTGEPILFTDTVHFKGKGNFNLHVRLLTSMLKEYTYLNTFNIYSWGSPEHFLPTDVRGNVHFSNYSDQGDTILFRTQGVSTGRRFKVNYYHDRVSLAPPPFSTVSSKPLRFRPDSSFYISNSMLVTGPQGIYQVLADTTANLGYSFFVFEQGYPFIANSLQMVQSARYLMTQKEYTLCMENADKKASIDAFWLSVCGNTNRARKQMADYYSGVEQANRLFASYTEGWKTDRGMMYIVLGAPDMVYRSATSETWVYGEAGYSRSITLQFNKTSNPFTENEFRLERMPTFKDSWYVSVNNWRR